MDPGSSKRPLYAGHGSALPDWASIADCICEVLDMVYVRKRKSLLRHAESRGITLEQLAAAAIAEMIRLNLSESLIELN